MLQVVLCDDDPQILSSCGSVLEALAKKNGHILKLFTYPNPQAMLFAVEDLLDNIDIFYLDVQMKPIGGIEAARRLRGMGYEGSIIFLTNAREAVFESFDVSPLQYLVKGEYALEKFERVFLRGVELSQKRAVQVFHCERGSERRSFSLRDITYFEVTKRIVTLHYSKGIFEFYSSMEEVEAKLANKGFVRTHRSYLVNVGHIRRLGQEYLELTNGEQVPLGRTYVRQVKERLSHYLTGGITQ